MFNDFNAANRPVLQVLDLVPVYPFAKLDELVEWVERAGTLPGALTAEEEETTIACFRLEARQLLATYKSHLFYAVGVDEQRALTSRYLGWLRLCTEKLNMPADHNQSLLSLKRKVAGLCGQLRESIGRFSGQQEITPEIVPRETGNTVQPKIWCELTVDQLGILLKAADDTRLIRSRSLSLIFKRLVPYLSTTNRAEISWDSMRSSTYHPGEPDKEAVISALRQLIEKIRGFH